MQEQPPQTQDQDSISKNCIAQTIQPSIEAWYKLRRDILNIENFHFGENAISEESFMEAFLDPETSIAITTDTRNGKLVGYTYAQPTMKAYGPHFEPERIQDKLVAYIQSTALDPEYMGHGLVGPMIAALEEDLFSKGFKYIERDAAVANGYAANIARNYGQRVITSKPKTAPEGDQMFFRISLFNNII